MPELFPSYIYNSKNSDFYRLIFKYNNNRFIVYFNENICRVNKT